MKSGTFYSFFISLSDSESTAQNFNDRDDDFEAIDENRSLLERKFNPAQQSKHSSS